MMKNIDIEHFIKLKSALSRVSLMRLFSPNAAEPLRPRAVEHRSRRRSAAVRRMIPETPIMRRLHRSPLPVAVVLLLEVLRPAVAMPVQKPDELAKGLAAAAPDANPEVLSLAAHAAACAREQGVQGSVPRLAVIDYSRPSTQPRLWVFDVERMRLLFRELVAHGRGTGERTATKFSNVDGSKMSSLGLFRTADTYVGGNGYSLRLVGLERGVNDHAESRAIVMHGAPYVSQAIARTFGRLGRSWGCPAVREEIARPVIDTLKGGALLFAYYPDHQWLDGSRFLSCPSGGPAQRVRAAAASAGAAGG